MQMKIVNNPDILPAIAATIIAETAESAVVFNVVLMEERSGVITDL